MFYIYRHIRLDTNRPFYIGKGSGLRWSDLKNRNVYHKSIQNKASVKCEVVSRFNDELEAYKFEERLIAIYKKYGMAEANLSIGGRGGASGTRKPEKAEIMRQMNISRRGKPLVWTLARKLAAAKRVGWKRPQETVEKTVRFHKGRKRSLETCKKNSESKKGKPLSLQHKEKLSTLGKASKINLMKPVLCVESGQKFESLKSAARAVKTNKSNIKAVAGVKARTCKGYHWEYC